jgi:hypothetical protein
MFRRPIVWHATLEVTPLHLRGQPAVHALMSRLISWKVRRCSAVPRTPLILVPLVQYDPKYSGGEGHGSRPAEHALLRIMSDGKESIYLKVIDTVQPAYRWGKKVWSTLQKAFGAC